MHLGGEVLVKELRSTVANDDIAIGSVGPFLTRNGQVSNIAHTPLPPLSYKRL